jgi:putative nucleotidyltransferase with HDIG domain
MNKVKKRFWIVRLWRLPQIAGERTTRLLAFIPPRVRLYLFSLLLIIPTTLLVSPYPVSLVPLYHLGDTVREDVVVPADLQLELSAQPGMPPGESSHRPRIVLHAGEVVNDKIRPIIEAIRKHQLAERRPQRLIGLLGLMVLVFLALYRAAQSSGSGRLDSRRAFWVAATAILIQAAINRIGMFIAAVFSSRPETMWFGDFFTFQFAIPFAASALIVALLVGSHLALVVALFTSLLVGLNSPFGIIMAVYSLAGAIPAIYSVQKFCARNAIIWANLIAAGVNILIGTSVLLLSDHPFSWQVVLQAALAGAVGASLAAAIASVGTPVYESAFGILTDIKLLELSNADLPLLRQLAIQTPGTNHHSYVVGTLAEAAAKAIGANALLTRIGCLYHDIGKLGAPKMYIENQGGAPNPHDRIAPRDSVRVITGHVRRGLQMGHEAKLPQQIIDFIPQHHGTRVLAFFYHKAKAQAEAAGETVNIDDFRYPGPKPQTREAVILMFADGSEAAVRSLEDQSPENIRAIVRKIIDSVIAEGQLDECNITFREITLIRESLIKELVSMHHQRISYPGFNPPDAATANGAKQSGAADAVPVVAAASAPAAMKAK